MRQSQVGHASLPVAVPMADGGLVLTGRLSPAPHPWLADHQILGAALVPGATLVEWVLRAADEAGRAGVELVLREPLVLPASAGVLVQVVVAAPDDDGRCDVRVYTRLDRDDGGWTCHADGVLGSEATAPPEGLAGVWPPPGADPVTIEDFYERAAAAGHEYGPAFQGLRALWRDGPDLLAEVELPEAAGEPGGFGIHPALLDAALHPALLDDEPGGDGTVWLPYSWNTVALWAGEATTVRVRLSPCEEGERGVRVVVADAVGAPVLTADAMTPRPADSDLLRAASRRGAPVLFALGWIPLPATPADIIRTGPDDGWAVLGPDELGLGAVSHPDLDALLTALDAGTPPPSLVLTHLWPAGGAEEEEEEDPLRVVETLSESVRAWLADPRLANTRLVVLTRNSGPDGTSLAGAAVRGLMRGFQAEDPGRFVLIDLDDDSTAEAVRRAVESEEPQLAVRAGEALVPRLARSTPGKDRPPVLDPEGTVLITVGPGTPAGLIAEHLVSAQQVRHLLLAGPSAPGTGHLSELGAQVEAATVDLADAAAVTDLIARIDPAHPLTAVIHTTPAASDLRPAWTPSQPPHRHEGPATGRVRRPLPRGRRSRRRGRTRAVRDPRLVRRAGRRPPRRRAARAVAGMGAGGGRRPAEPAGDQAAGRRVRAGPVRGRRSARRSAPGRHRPGRPCARGRPRHRRARCPARPRRYRCRAGEPPPDGPRWTGPAASPRYRRTSSTA